MRKITNGANTLIVTNGAFKSHYKNLGYKVVKESKKSAKNAKTAEEIAAEEEAKKAEEEAKAKAEEEAKAAAGGSGDDDEEDLKWAEEQKLVPIAIWEVDDLKRFIKINEIDLDGVKKEAKVRDKVQAWIKDNSEE